LRSGGAPFRDSGEGREPFASGGKRGGEDETFRNAEGGGAVDTASAEDTGSHEPYDSEPIEDAAYEDDADFGDDGGGFDGGDGGGGD
jgi:hypothetical protein